MFNAGIDKIKFVVNPLFLNKEGERPWHIKPDNSLTFNHGGGYLLFSIHAEYFNPLYDFKLFVAKAICELIEKKVFDFPYDYPMLTYLFVLNNINFFFLGISEIEFYFDFPPDKVSVKQSAIDNGDMIQFVKDGVPQETYYSKDYNPNKQDSIYCVYNKKKKLLHDRRYTVKDIESMNVHYRIEARLNRMNCPYMDYSNLAGTYEDIFKKFLPFLAVAFFNYVYDFVEVKGRHNTHYERLLRQAVKGKVRCTNKKGLKKFEPIEQLPDDDEVRMQMREAVLANFSENMGNAENGVEVPEDSTEALLAGDSW